MKAAKRFFQQAVAIVGHAPERVTTDGHDSYPRAIRETFGSDVLHRTNVSIGGKLPKNAGIKFPSGRAWGILKQPGKCVPSCFKEAIHVSHRGTVHDQRFVSQRGFH